jgi:rRNA maturation protein Rpf1
MKKHIEIHSIEVPIIAFDNGNSIEVSILKVFFDEASEFEDTIGTNRYITDDYLYFPTHSEKILEGILLEHDVIRLSPVHDYHNSKIGIEKYYKDYRYWLSDGYYKFKDEFENEYYNG